MQADLIVATFDASSAKPEAATSLVTHAEADFPPLVEEASNESLESAPVEQRVDSPSYAGVVAEAPSDNKPTDAAPSQVTQEASSEPTQEKEISQPSYYAEMAAEELSSNAGVIAHNITSS